MVTIYYDTRTFRLRLPVIRVGRWSGALLVRIQHRCEGCLDEVSRLRREQRVAAILRARRYAAATHRAEADRDRATAHTIARGV